MTRSPSDDAQPQKANASARILPGFKVLPGYLDAAAQGALMSGIVDVVASAPLFKPTMPRTGKPFSVAMTNCGSLGWVSDKAGGYRYQATHPETGRPWPAMPDALLAIWRDLAGVRDLPEACLVNHYPAGARMGSHVDADEAAPEAAVISISLGASAVFHVGGLRRSEPKSRMTLASGDVVVLGGAARFAYHGIDRILAEPSPLVPWGGRINLTLRRVAPLSPR